MITIHETNLNKPKTRLFEDLVVGEMFLSPKNSELLVKISEDTALGIDAYMIYSYDPNALVQLCDVNISYTPLYESL